MKQNNMLVIQLLRLGDLIQTAKAVRQLKAENPEIKVSLLARRRFAEPLKFLLETVFDDLIFFEAKDFICQDLSESVKSTNLFINDIKSRSFDITINLSFNKSSGYLTKLIDTKFATGIKRNNLNQITIADNWSQYIFATVMKDNLNPFNLVDLFRFILGCKDNFELENFNESIKENLIVIHPFASSRKKHWGASKWSELCNKILSTNPKTKIHIVGAKSDLDDAKQIALSPALEKNRNQIYLDINKDLSTVYELLAKAKLFIGHDSMVSHLASETLTPSLILSLGTVRPQETTPYQKNVINLSPKTNCFPCDPTTSCSLLTCHSHMPLQIVSACALQMLEQGEVDMKKIQKEVNPFHLSSVRIMTQELYLENLESYNTLVEDHTPKEVFQYYYQILWHLYFNDIDIEIKYPSISKETAIELQNHLEGTQYLFELYNFGIKYSNQLIKEHEKDAKDFDSINQTIKKLDEINSLINITLRSYPLLGNLINVFYVKNLNIQSTEFKTVCEDQLLNFYDAVNLVKALHSLLEKTIGPYLDKSSHKSISEV